MSIGLQAKFDQNPGLAEKLKNIGMNLLVESSPNDTYWGTGIHMQHKNAFVEWYQQTKQPSYEGTRNCVIR